MRVLFLAQRTHLPEGEIPPNGSGAHVAATRAGLREHFDVRALLSEEGPSPDRARSKARALVPGLVRGLRQDALLLAAERRFVRRAFEVAREFRADVVVERSEYLSVAGLRVARRLGVPLVLEVNGLLDRDVRSMYRSPLEPLGAGLERLKHRRADVVVTVSPGLADLLAARGAARDRLVIVPNSVPDERVRPEPRPVRPEGATVGWVGHLMRWHLEALADLVDVAPRILARHPEVRFEILGGGPGLDDLRYRVRVLRLEERFHFVGPVPYGDVPRKLESVDVGVIPAVFDYAFPVKLVDLGAAGIPVVAPASDSLDRMIEPGVEYEPFAAGRPEALVEAVCGLLADPARRGAMGEALRRAVADRFTWRSTGAALAQAIERAVARRR
jgi:glycosyltransferase involved in cell wall biosynthesis